MVKKIFINLLIKWYLAIGGTERYFHDQCIDDATTNGDKVERIP